MELPPGIRWLAQRLHKILAPPVFVFILSVICQTYLYVQIPRWALSIIYLISFPVALTATVLYGDYRIDRMAAACSAVVPAADSADRSIGRIKTVLQAARLAKEGYVGECTHSF